MNKVIKEEQEIKVVKNLEDLHKELFILLCEFDDFCKENNIKYSLTSGTLIGAIREKGFIPWDDDIDVVAFAKDFPKIIDAVKKEYPNKYEFAGIFYDYNKN